MSAATSQGATAPTVETNRSANGTWAYHIVTFPAPITEAEFWAYVVERHYFDRHPAGYGLGRIRVNGCVGVYTCAASCD